VDAGVKASQCLHHSSKQYEKRRQKYGNWKRETRQRHGSSTGVDKMQRGLFPQQEKEREGKCK